MAAIPGEPGESSFHDPAMSAEMRGAVDPLAGDTRYGVPGAARRATSAAVVSLVGVQLDGPLSGPPSTTGAYARDRIEDGSQGRTVVTVRAGEDQAERRAPPVGDDMALRARLASVRRVRARCGSPFLAPIEALSIDARDQSSSPAWCNRSSRAR